MNKVRFVGLDVHADTIAVAVAEPDGEVRALGTIPNRPDSIRRLVKQLGPADRLRMCYEAGPTGYVLYWQLTGLGVHCDVVAPTLVPTKSGDRVKTDRRDAVKLARSYRAGDLTAVGSGCDARGVARCGAGARSGKEGPTPCPSSVGQVLIAHGTASPVDHNGLDAAASAVGEDGSF